MDKVIIQIALFRRGVERFEKDLNKLLSEGYKLKSVTVEKKGLRFVCMAVVETA